MLHRRGLLAGLGALLAAPAIIRTEGLLMPVRPRLILWGDGVHDDTDALQAILSGRADRVSVPAGVSAASNADGVSLIGGTFRVSRTLFFDGGGVRGLHVADGSFFGAPLDDIPATSGIGQIAISSVSQMRIERCFFDMQDGQGNAAAAIFDSWERPMG